jgi:hypothetical protein
MSRLPRVGAQTGQRELALLRLNAKSGFSGVSFTCVLSLVAERKEEIVVATKAGRRLSPHQVRDLWDPRHAISVPSHGVVPLRVEQDLGSTGQAKAQCHLLCLRSTILHKLWGGQSCPGSPPGTPFRRLLGPSASVRVPRAPAKCRLAATIGCPLTGQSFLIFPLWEALRVLKRLPAACDPAVAAFAELFRR